MQDVPEAVRCCNEEQIRQFIPPLPIPYTEDDAIAFIGAAQQRLEDGSVTLVIGDAADGGLRGSIGLRAIAPGRRPDRLLGGAGGTRARPGRSGAGAAVALGAGRRCR